MADFNKRDLQSHQRKLKGIWNNHISVKKHPTNQWVYPGPGSYANKNYIQDEPSFSTHKFHTTVRPLNTVTIKGQTEEIEYGQYHRINDKVEAGNTYRGYESSIGMSPRRTTDIGRRLLNGAGEDEKLAPFF